MSQSTIFQSCRDGATASWVLPVLSGSKAQGHNTAEVGFEPRPLAPESDALPLSSPNTSVETILVYDPLQYIHAYLL